MCKTHCFDTDQDNSDQEGAGNLITPPIKISFNAPDGQNVMEIEPKYYKKSSHKRKHSKHKNKKHAKKSKHHDREDGDDHDDARIAEDNGLEAEKPVIANAAAASGACTLFDDMEEEDSDAQGLVIDIPGETSTKTTKKSGPANSCRNEGSRVIVPSLKSPLSTTSETPSEPPLSKTKTKAQLRRQKFTPKVSRTQQKAKAAHADEPASIVSEMKSRCIPTYMSANGKHVSVGDVIWGKIVGFPWWPGRVCTITVNETQDDIILDHIADIDWYCSPTKSHLPCSAIYPFLEDFAKRLDKKKKTKSYVQAVNEAKCDAVLNEQYLQAMVEPDDREESNTSPSPQHSPEHAHNQSTMSDSDTLTYTQPSDGKENGITDDSSNTLVVKTDDTEGKDSPSLLIDAFLRTNDHPSATYSDAMSDTYSLTAASGSATRPNESTYSNEVEGCLTISLPSPRSLLSSN